MESISVFQRFDSSYHLLANEFTSAKDELEEIRSELQNVVEENKRLRRDLKECLENQLPSKDINSKAFLNGLNDVDKQVVQNLEKQMDLLRREREDAMQMWQTSLLVIAQLEQDLKNYQFQSAPQSMSFELELKKRQEQFARTEATLVKEIAMLKAEANKKDEELMDHKLKQNELRLQVENLYAQMNQKDQDRRNMIKKEFGYDDALLSLQNDISTLETKVLSLTKDNQYLKDSLHDSQSKISSLNKINLDLESRNHEIKAKLEESAVLLQKLKTEKVQLEQMDTKHREEHDKLHNVISELMDEAALKTKQELESLRRIYNANIEKLIEECNALELDRNNKDTQLEKAMRIKRSLEQEMERVNNEYVRNSTMENLSFEDLHRRMCLMERERDQAVAKLETKEAELKKLQNIFENDKEKNQLIFAEYTEKTYQTTRELEKLADDYTKVLGELEGIRNKLSSVQSEKDELQKKLTKQLQVHENEIQLKTNEYLTKSKTQEENHSRTVFELRQLLNMQQRMSNKWKEECHTITNQSEAKFNEMKKNFENLRQYNEKLARELQDAKRKEVENERAHEHFQNKIKVLEGRVKDAEYQANEATKRISKQMAREKMLAYEKHLMESDLQRNYLDFNNAKLVDHQVPERMKKT